MFDSTCSSYNPEFFVLHSMFDAIWEFWQSKGPEYRVKQKGDNTTKVVHFNVTRSLYLDNTNLGNRGMKIKYTPIF